MYCSRGFHPPDPYKTQSYSTPINKHCLTVRGNAATLCALLNDTESCPGQILPLQCGSLRSQWALQLVSSNDSPGVMFGPLGLKPPLFVALIGTLRLRSGQALESMPCRE